MPIKAENKSKYPANWKHISEVIRFVRAGNRCEFCGVDNYAVGYRDTDGEFVKVSDEEMMAALEDGYKVIKIVLTVAHLDHDPRNCSDDNLKALCQKCHLDYDKEHHAKNRQETQRQKKLAAGNVPLW